jgi:hypothetical protein
MAGALASIRRNGGWLGPEAVPARHSGRLVTGSVSLLSGSVKDLAIAATAFPTKRSYFVWLAMTHPTSK